MLLVMPILFTFTFYLFSCVYVCVTHFTMSMFVHGKKASGHLRCHSSSGNVLLLFVMIGSLIEPKFGKEKRLSGQQAQKPACCCISRLSTTTLSPSPSCFQEKPFTDGTISLALVLPIFGFITK